MPDICMCADKDCPQRASCYRYRARPTGYQDKNGKWHTYQSFFLQSPRPENRRKKCPQFWDCSQESIHPPYTLRTLEQADEANGKSE